MELHPKHPLTLRKTHTQKELVVRLPAFPHRDFRFSSPPRHSDIIHHTIISCYNRFDDDNLNNLRELFRLVSSSLLFFCPGRRARAVGLISPMVRTRTSSGHQKERNSYLSRDLPRLQQLEKGGPISMGGPPTLSLSQCTSAGLCWILLFSWKATIEGACPTLMIRRAE